MPKPRKALTNLDDDVGRYDCEKQGTPEPTQLTHSLSISYLHDWYL